jgi:hypothetical protein
MVNYSVYFRIVMFGFSYLRMGCIVLGYSNDLIFIIYYVIIPFDIYYDNRSETKKYFSPKSKNLKRSESNLITLTEQVIILIILVNHIYQYEECNLFIYES